MRRHAGLPFTDLLDEDVALLELPDQAVQIKRVAGQLDGDDNIRTDKQAGSPGVRRRNQAWYHP